MRPRQARYQAALRPDINCFIHSKALPNFTATPIHRFWWWWTVPKLCQILLLNRGCARISRHLIGLAVHFLQALSLQLQFHLQILLEDLCVALSKELRNPLVGDTSCTEPRRIGEAQLIDPEVGNSCAFQCLPPCSLEILMDRTDFCHLGTRRARSPRSTSGNLSPEVVDYFKGLAQETGLPYQKLFDLYLFDCAKKRRKLMTKRVA